MDRPRQLGGRRRGHGKDASADGVLEVGPARHRVPSANKAGLCWEQRADRSQHHVVVHATVHE
eukprot:3968812-Lingulodinium_polyedra.AAC.1